MAFNCLLSYKINFTLQGNNNNNISIKQEDPEIKEEIEDESDTSFIETENKPIEKTIETHVKGNRKIIISEKQPKTKVPDKPLEDGSNNQNKAQDNQLKPEPASTVLNNPSMCSNPKYIHFTIIIILNYTGCLSID